MDIASTLRRAARGMREEARLHVVAVSSLTIAFLCLGSALLLLANLGSLASAWERAGRVTIFLRDGARSADVQELASTPPGLPGAVSVTHISPRDAREQFVPRRQVRAPRATAPDFHPTAPRSKGTSPHARPALQSP